MVDDVNVKRIDGQVRTVRQLLDGARYAIDFYQREYAWQERHVRDLLDDLTDKFEDSYRAGQERRVVAQYNHYFLGSIVVSNKNQQRFIVDGQQRLTTLTLLLIHLHHLSKQRPEVDSVETLIFSKRFGEKRFNLDVDERVKCMERLLHGEEFDPAGTTESVQNIVARFRNIQSLFPESIAGDALPYFVDWLTECVHLIEIEAYSDEDAYTIFETMNDRGLSLSLPDMLKGYVLANIDHESDQRRVNELWKKHVHAFGKDDSVDFFKNWLRGVHAKDIQSGNKGGDPKDYEQIGSAFHRWVRDQSKELGLVGATAFVRFIDRDFDFYARQALAIRAASVRPTDGLEAIYFNAERDFTTQAQVLLSALTPDDSPADVERKLQLVSTYLDIWLTRQTWAYRSSAQRTVRHAMFTLTRVIRGKSIAELAVILRQRLDADTDTFARHYDLGRHQQNFYAVRHVLARITHWVDQQCGLNTHFEDYFATGKGRPFEVEHIWADQHEQFKHWYPHQSDFDRARNRIGGLVLLQRGPNQSLGDKPYEDKRDAYVAQGQTILTRSLHPFTYENNPVFRAFLERTGLKFRPIDHFDPDAQQERQELYVRIAEWVWNPSRLDLDGEKPPVPELLHGAEEDEEEAEGAMPVEKGMRHQMRRRFWATVVERARQTGAMHAELTPTEYSWLGVREDGFWWNFAVTQRSTRVELVISSWEKARNKAIYDYLVGARETIEAAYGGRLGWHRLDGNIQSKISTTVAGGWLDEPGFTATTDRALAAMRLLYEATLSHAKAAKVATA
jgi:uncharacterized protein with ParB-like and HNH nuclease domain